MTCAKELLTEAEGEPGAGGGEGGIEKERFMRLVVHTLG